MNNEKFLLITPDTESSKAGPWWAEDTACPHAFHTQILEGFDSAMAAFRETVAELIEGCDDFPVDDENYYTPLTDYMDMLADEAEDDPELEDYRKQAAATRELLREVLFAPNYVLPEYTTLCMEDTDDADEYYAWVGGDTGLTLMDRSESGTVLRLNHHCRQATGTTYYFEFWQETDCESPEYRLSVRLIPMD